MKIDFFCRKNMNSNIKKIINSYYNIKFKSVVKNKMYDSNQTIYYENDVYKLYNKKLYINGSIALNFNRYVEKIVRYKNKIYISDTFNVACYEITNGKLTYLSTINTGKYSVGNFIVCDDGSLIVEKEMSVVQYPGRKHIGNFYHLMRNKLVLLIHKNKILAFYDINTKFTDYIYVRREVKIISLDIIYIDGKYCEVSTNEN